MTDSQPVHQMLKEAFDLVAEELVAAGYPERGRFAYELLDVNEAGVALETMCSNLYEFDCPVPLRAWQLFRDAGTVMGVESSYWDVLESLIVE